MERRTYLERPTKDAIRELPVFEGLPDARIRVVRSATDLERAEADILEVRHVGFDTESRPNFQPGGKSSGPHVVQLATTNHAYLFRPGTEASDKFIASVVESKSLTKVGFGLRSDRQSLAGKFGTHLRSVLDMSTVVRKLGYRQAVGVQAAVAIVLGQYLAKSKSLTTSNWAVEPLSKSQRAYAANDAYASLLVYLELARSSPHLFMPA